MKIIFLDVDGVLNSRKFLIENVDSFNRKTGNYLEIDEEKVKILRIIVDATDAKLVLSSSWRSFWNSESIIPENIKAVLFSEMLEKYNLKIYDLTPRGNIRQEEIEKWLSVHPKVEAFVIIDDDLEHVIKFKDNNLVKTSFYGENGGLTEAHAKEAIKILKKTK